MSGIGIDVGNSFTRVAMVGDDQNVELFTFEKDEKSFPTILRITEDGQFIVGKDAKETANDYPKTTIYGIKRFFATDFKTCVENGQPYPFELVNDHKLASVQCPLKDGNKVFSSQELLKQIYHKVAEHPAAKDKKCVITIPSYFTPQQRESVRTAAKESGLNVRDVVTEQAAAMAAYGEKLSKGKHTILIFDFSQSNTIVSIYRGNSNNFKELTIAGDDVGGDDVTNDAAQFLAREFRATYKQNLSRNEEGMKKLKNALDQQKLNFLTENSIELNIPGIIEGVDYKETISKEKFEYMTDDAYGRAADQITVALDQAHLKKTDLTEVIVCGGSSRIERMRSIVEQVTGLAPLSGIDPSNVIVFGAAQLASKL